MKYGAAREANKMRLNSQILITALVASISICFVISVVIKNDREIYQNKISDFYAKTIIDVVNVIEIHSAEGGIDFLRDKINEIVLRVELLNYLQLFKKNGELIVASTVKNASLAGIKYPFSTTFNENLSSLGEISVDGRAFYDYAALHKNGNIVVRFGIDKKSLLYHVQVDTTPVYLLYLFCIIAVGVAAYFWAYRLTHFINACTATIDSIRDESIVEYVDKGYGVPEFSQLIASISSLYEIWKTTLEEIKNKEKYLLTTLNSIGDAVISTDLSGRIINMNPVAEKLTGWMLNEAAGKDLLSVFSIINGFTGDPIKNLISKVVTANDIINVDDSTILVNKDQEECRISDSAAPIRDALGKVVGVIIVFRNVTEQYALREKIERSADRLRDILNDMQTMLGIVDLKGNLVFVNNLPVKITGVTANQVLNKKFSDAIWFNFDAKLSERIQNDLEVCFSGESTYREEKVYTLNGLLWVCIGMHPLFDSEGRVKEVVVEGQDISDRKRSEEHLRRSQKMEALGKLTGGIAHDYNNMLGVIQGYAELLSDDLSENPEMLEYAKQIVVATERSVNLTQKLLNFSRKESVESTIVTLNDALLEQRTMLEKSIALSVSLKFNLAVDPWKVRIEVRDFEDAILNLSINSMHAMADHKHGVICYSSSNVFLDEIDASALQLEEGEYVKISVSDNGCGIGNATRQRIFEPFFTTKGDRGTGLGLSQVYSFVKRNKGNIKVYSEEGRGTEFTMYFPRNCSEQIVEVKPNDIEGGGGLETILIVDDEPALTQLAYEILSRQGYNIFTANSASEALVYMDNEPIDLLISDIIMPEMDGYELANIVRKKHPSIKIQMASGFTSESQSGGLFHTEQPTLTKPYRKNTLISTVRNILSAGGAIDNQ